MPSTQIDRLAIAPPVRVFTGPTAVCQIVVGDEIVEIRAGNVAVTCVLPPYGGPYTIVDGSEVAGTFPIVVLNASGSEVGTIDAAGGSASFAWDGLRMLQIGDASGISPALRPVVGASTTAAALTLLGGASAGALAALASITVASVATIAALRLASAAMPPAVYLDGYSTPADGGNGMFIYVATDTTTADDGGTVIVDAANRRWHRDLEAKLPSVKWFGAKGDGVTNDAPAFNAALASGTAISMPPGKYLLNSALSYIMPSATAVLTMIGAGSDLTQLIWPAGQGMAVNFISAFNSCHLRDFSCLTGSAGTSGQTAISLNQQAATPNSANSPQSDVMGVTCRGSDGYLQTAYWGSGITSNGVSNINFTNVDVAGSAVIATNISNGVIVQGTSTSPPVVFNFTGCDFTGVHIGVLYGNFVQGVTVNQSNFTDCNFGIVAASAESGLDQLSVTASQFACLDAGILTRTAVSSVTAIGNLFIVPDGAFGIDLEHANALMIVGNSFVPSVTAVGAIGIAVNDTAAPVGTITGNSFLGMGGVAIQLGAATSGINVQSNAYSGNGANVSNAGTNTIGGGSP